MGRREDDPRTHEEESHDSRDLQGREAVFDRAKKFDVESVHDHKHERKADNPQPSWNGSKPETHVDRHSRDLCSERKDDTGPIGKAHEKPSQWRQVELCPCAEGTGGRM